MIIYKVQKFFKNFITFVLIFTFFIQNSFVFSKVNDFTFSNNVLQSNVNFLVKDLIIGLNTGRVCDYFDQGNTKSKVMIIKDLHCNEEAQKNIYKILDEINKEYSSNNFLFDDVLIEGAWSDLRNSNDLKFLKSLPEGFLKTFILENTFLKDKFSGAEKFVINNIDKNLLGIEDEKAYKNNLSYFIDLKEKEELNYLLIRLINSYIALKNTQNYSRDLRKLDNLVVSYKKNKISIIEYIDRLQEFVMFFDLSKEIPNLLKNYEYAKKINSLNSSKKIMLEALTMERILFSKLSRKEFLKISELKKNKDYTEYYLYLQKLINEKRYAVLLDNNFNNLFLYFDYLNKLSSLDVNAMHDEESKFVYKIANILAKDDRERKFLKLGRVLTLFYKFVNNNVINSEVKEINDNILEYIKIFKSFAQKNIKDYLSANFLLDTCKNLEDKLYAMKNFYKIAEKRNFIFADKIQSILENKNSSTEKIVILPVIVGGYHANGIANILKDRNIPYITISPNGGSSASSDYDKNLSTKANSVWEDLSTLALATHFENHIYKDDEIDVKLKSMTKEEQTKLIDNLVKSIIKDENIDWTENIDKITTKIEGKFRNEGKEILDLSIKIATSFKDVVDKKIKQVREKKINESKKNLETEMTSEKKFKDFLYKEDEKGLSSDLKQIKTDYFDRKKIVEDKKKNDIVEGKDEKINKDIEEEIENIRNKSLIFFSSILKIGGNKVTLENNLLNNIFEKNEELEQFVEKFQIQLKNKIINKQSFKNEDVIEIIRENADDDKLRKIEKNQKNNQFNIFISFFISSANALINNQKIQEFFQKEINKDKDKIFSKIMEDFIGDEKNLSEKDKDEIKKSKNEIKKLFQNQAQEISNNIIKEKKGLDLDKLKKDIAEGMQALYDNHKDALNKLFSFGIKDENDLKMFKICQNSDEILKNRENFLNDNKNDVKKMFFKEEEIDDEKYDAFFTLIKNILTNFVKNNIFQEKQFNDTFENFKIFDLLSLQLKIKNNEKNIEIKQKELIEREIYNSFSNQMNEGLTEKNIEFISSLRIEKANVLNKDIEKQAEEEIKDEYMSKYKGTVLKKIQEATTKLEKNDVSIKDYEKSKEEYNKLKKSKVLNKFNDIDIKRDTKETLLIEKSKKEVDVEDLNLGTFLKKKKEENKFGDFITDEKIDKGIKENLYNKQDDISKAVIDHLINVDYIKSDFKKEKEEIISNLQTNINAKDVIKMKDISESEKKSVLKLENHLDVQKNMKILFDLMNDEDKKDVLATLKQMEDSGSIQINLENLNKEQDLSLSDFDLETLNTFLLPAICLVSLNKKDLTPNQRLLFLNSMKSNLKNIAKENKFFDDSSDSYEKKLDKFLDELLSDTKTEVYKQNQEILKPLINKFKEKIKDFTEDKQVDLEDKIIGKLNFLSLNFDSIRMKKIADSLSENLNAMFLLKGVIIEKDGDLLKYLDLFFNRLDSKIEKNSEELENINKYVDLYIKQEKTFLEYGLTKKDLEENEKKLKIKEEEIKEKQAKLEEECLALYSEIEEKESSILNNLESNNSEIRASIIKLRKKGALMTEELYKIGLELEDLDLTKKEIEKIKKDLSILDEIELGFKDIANNIRLDVDFNILLSENIKKINDDIDLNKKPTKKDSSKKSDKSLEVVIQAVLKVEENFTEENYQDALNKVDGFDSGEDLELESRKLELKRRLSVLAYDMKIFDINTLEEKLKKIDERLKEIDKELKEKTDDKEFKLKLDLISLRNKEIKKLRDKGNIKDNENRDSLEKESFELKLEIEELKNKEIDDINREINNLKFQYDRDTVIRKASALASLEEEMERLVSINVFQENKNEIETIRKELDGFKEIFKEYSNYKELKEGKDTLLIDDDDENKDVLNKSIDSMSQTLDTFEKNFEQAKNEKETLLIRLKDVLKRLENEKINLEQDLKNELTESVKKNKKKELFLLKKELKKLKSQVSSIDEEVKDIIKWKINDINDKIKNIYFNKINQLKLTSYIEPLENEIKSSIKVETNKEKLEILKKYLQILKDIRLESKINPSRALKIFLENIEEIKVNFQKNMEFSEEIKNLLQNVEFNKYLSFENQNLIFSMNRLNDRSVLNRISYLEFEKENLQNSYDVKNIDALKQDLDNNILRINNQIDHEDSKIEMMNKTINRLKDLQKNITKLKFENEKKKIEAKAEIESLKKEIQDSKDSEKNNLKEKENLEKEIEQKRKKLEDINEEINTKKKNKENKEEDIKNKEKEIKEKDDFLSKLKELEKQLKNKMVELEKEKEKLSNLTTKDVSLNEQKKEYEKNIDELNVKIKELKEKLQKIQENLEKSKKRKEIEEKENNKNKLKEKLKKVNEELNGNEADIENLKNFETYKNDYEKLKKDLSSITDEINRTNKQLKDLEKETFNLDKLIQEKDKELQNLLKEYGEYEAIKEKLEKNGKTMDDVKKDYEDCHEFVVVLENLYNNSFEYNRELSFMEYLYMEFQALEKISFWEQNLTDSQKQGYEKFFQEKLKETAFEDLEKARENSKKWYELYKKYERNEEKSTNLNLINMDEHKWDKFRVLTELKFGKVHGEGFTEKKKNEANAIFKNLKDVFVEMFQGYDDNLAEENFNRMEKLLEKFKEYKEKYGFNVIDHNIKEIIEKGQGADIVIDKLRKEIEELKRKQKQKNDKEYKKLELEKEKKEKDKKLKDFDENIKKFTKLENLTKAKKNLENEIEDVELTDEEKNLLKENIFDDTELKTEKDILEEELKALLEELKQKKEIYKDIVNQINVNNLEIENINKKILELEKEIGEIEQKIKDLKDKFTNYDKEEITKQIDKDKETINENDESIKVLSKNKIVLEEEIKKLEENKKNIDEKINGINKKKTENNKKIKDLQNELKKIEKDLLKNDQEKNRIKQEIEKHIIGKVRAEVYVDQKKEELENKKALLDIVLKLKEQQNKLALQEEIEKLEKEKKEKEDEISEQNKEIEKLNEEKENLEEEKKDCKIRLEEKKEELENKEQLSVRKNGSRIKLDLALDMIRLKSFGSNIKNIYKKDLYRGLLNNKKDSDVKEIGKEEVSDVKVAAIMGKVNEKLFSKKFYEKTGFDKIFDGAIKGLNQILNFQKNLALFPGVNLKNLAETINKMRLKEYGVVDEAGFEIVSKSESNKENDSLTIRVTEQMEALLLFLGEKGINTKDIYQEIFMHEILELALQKEKINQENAHNMVLNSLGALQKLISNLSQTKTLKEMAEILRNNGIDVQSAKELEEGIDKYMYLHLNQEDSQYLLDMISSSKDNLNTNKPIPLEIQLDDIRLEKFNLFLNRMDSIEKKETLKDLGSSSLVPYQETSTFYPFSGKVRLKLKKDILKFIKLGVDIVNNKDKKDEAKKKNEDIKLIVSKSDLEEPIIYENEQWIISKNNITLVNCMQYLTNDLYLVDLAQALTEKDNKVQEIKTIFSEIYSFKNRKFLIENLDNFKMLENFKDILALCKRFQEYQALEQNEKALLSSSKNDLYKTLKKEFDGKDFNIILDNAIKKQVENDIFTKDHKFNEYNKIFDFIKNIYDMKLNKRFFDIDYIEEFLNYLKNANLTFLLGEKDTDFKTKIDILARFNEIMKYMLEEEQKEIEEESQEIIIDIAGSNDVNISDFINKKLKENGIYKEEDFQNKNIVIRGDTPNLVSENESESNLAFSQIQFIANKIIKLGGKITYIPSFELINKIVSRDEKNIYLQRMIQNGFLKFSHYFPNVRGIVLAPGIIIDQNIVSLAEEIYGKEKFNSNKEKFMDELLNIEFRRKMNLDVDKNIASSLNTLNKNIFNIFDAQNYSKNDINEILKENRIRQFVLINGNLDRYKAFANIDFSFNKKIVEIVTPNVETGINIIKFSDDGSLNIKVSSDDDKDIKIIPSISTSLEGITKKEKIFMDIKYFVNKFYRKHIKSILKDLFPKFKKNDYRKNEILYQNELLRGMMSAA